MLIFIIDMPCRTNKINVSVVFFSFFRQEESLYNISNSLIIFVFYFYFRHKFFCIHIHKKKD